MNDRFKFRLWTPLTRKMQTDNEEIFLKLNGNLSLCLEKDNAIWNIDYLDLLKEQEKIINTKTVLMQCIGLKDKKGNLIYEGDICEEADDELIIIYWNKKWLKFDYEFVNISQERRSDVCFEYFTKTITIRGNIYETPELLTISNLI